MFNFSKSNHIDFSRLYHEAVNIYDNIPAVKRRRRRRLFFKALRYGAYFVLFLILIFFLFFISNIMTIKDIYERSMKGKGNIEYALSMIKSQSYGEAARASAEAEIEFDACRELAEKMQSTAAVKYIPPLKWQIEYLHNLMSTAALLSKAGKDGANFGQSIKDLLSSDKDIAFGTFTAEENKKILGRIYEAGPDFEQLRSDLSQAASGMKKIESAWIMIPVRSKISKVREQIDEAVLLLDEAIPMSKILPPLLGYPDHAEYLVVMQNSDELRPSGGFIGTFGTLDLENGNIASFSTHDVYHLDMPVKDIYKGPALPLPLAKYLGVEKWFFRDSNWSPDWPTSAAMIERMYMEESALLKEIRAREKKADQVVDSIPADDFDGVIGITPKFVTDLLKIAGPITIEGIEYSENNFTDILEYRVEKGYVQLGEPSWQRKEVIGDIAKELKSRLFALPLSDWSQVFNAVKKNAVEKNIVVYSKRPELEKTIQEKGYGGEVKAPEDDYLMVVDANLAALKTDRVMQRSIDYKLEELPQGMFAKLQLNYSNNGSFDWKTTRYRSYTRVYVPAGSRLVKYDGLSEGEMDVSTEKGKTVFGGFISIEPGEQKSLTIEYQLPMGLSAKTKEGKYAFYVQKQPGKEVLELSVDLQFNNSIKLYGPTGFSSEKMGPSRIKWVNDLSTDRQFAVEFD